MKKLRLVLDAAWIVAGMIRLVFNPKDISPIFRVRSFREHRSVALALESMRARPEVAEMIRTRWLAPRPIDLDELMRLPEGTLGRVFAEHMRKYDLRPEFYPPMPSSDLARDDDVLYVRQRARQTHDIWHVVCGFPAIDIGEMAISAFYLAQHRIPLSALLIGTGFFYVTLRQPHRLEELFEGISLGWRMGKEAKPLFAVKWEERWSEPIESVRESLGIRFPAGAFDAAIARADLERAEKKSA